MFYIVYKITNNINQKFYIGCHKTDNLNDAYMGSGKLIKKAIKKYGNENFCKEILFIFDNEVDMFAKEKELVTEELVKNKKCYNVKLGGTANYYYINHNNLNHKVNQHLILAERLKTDSEYYERFKEKMTQINRLNGLKKRGKPTAIKGKIAIYKDNKTKYIFEEDKQEYFNNGWYQLKDQIYTYTCKFCGKVFTTKRKRNINKNTFCSKKCQINFINKKSS